MTAKREARNIQVLLVEDNAGDVRLITEALAEVEGRPSVHVVYDGSQALDYLWRRGQFAHAPRPDLVILDLNLPKKDGREVLAVAKGDVSLKRIPVVVFSSSSAPADIAASYELHANSYVIKPFGLEQFMERVRNIARFWLSVAALPPGDEDRGGGAVNA